MLETHLVSFQHSNNTGAIDVKMDGYVLEEKSCFKMLGLTFSSKLDWGPYIMSIAKTVSKKIGTLIRSMKFLFPEVALYLHKSTIRPCMEYCDLLDKLHKWICRTMGALLATSLEPLAHYRNETSLVFSIGITLVEVELAQLVPLPYSPVRSTRYSDRLYDFSVTIPRCFRDVCVNCFFLRATRL